MSNRNYTQEIYAQECIGDSLGKHNYNILNLEQKLSDFYYLKNLSIETLLDIDNKFSLLNNIKTGFINNKRLSQCLGVVRILEKHWKNKNIQVYFPINLSELWEDPEIRCITKEEKFEYIISKLKKHLYLKYHPSSYKENTKIHFVVPIYNTPVAAPEDDYKIFDKNKSSNVDIFVSNPFSYENRTQNVKITKKSQHISQVQTFIFKNYDQKRWVLIDHLSGERFETKISTTETAATLQMEVNEIVYNYNLYEEVLKTYSDSYIPGKSKIELKIQPNGYIGSKSSLVPSLIIQNFNISDEIIIYNYGHIYGAGGTGIDGQDAYPSSISNRYINYTPEQHDGGPAIFAGCSISLFNYGKIYGGGGGGSGGTSASTVVPPMTALSVFNPELEDLWCCYKYDIAKTRYESDLANGVIEYVPETNPLQRPVPTYSAGGGGGGGQGLTGGLPGKQGSLYLPGTHQHIVVDATAGTIDYPGSGGLGSSVTPLSAFLPDSGGSGGSYGNAGSSSNASSAPGGYGGFSILGIKNVTLQETGDIRGEMF